MSQSPSQTNRILGGLLRLLLALRGFLRLAALLGEQPLRLVVRMGLFMVFAARTAEKEQDRLSIATHIKSLVRRRASVKAHILGRLLSLVVNTA